VNSTELESLGGGFNSVTSPGPVEEEEDSPEVKHGLDRVQDVGRRTVLDRILVTRCRDQESLLALIELLPRLLAAEDQNVRAIFIDSLAQPFRQEEFYYLILL
jgi:hypothetical protein